MTNGSQQYQPRPLGWARTGAALLLPAMAGLGVLLVSLPFQRQKTRNRVIRLVSRMALRLSRVHLVIDDPDQHLQQRPAIFTVNHESALDPLLVAAALQRDVAPVVKAGLRHQFPVGWLLAACGAVFVNRDGTGSSALAPAARALSEGMAVALAPQGTRMSQVLPGSFRPGAVHLARETGAPLVMLFLSGAGARMPNRQWRIYPGTVELRILGVLEPANASVESLEQHYLQASGER